MRALCGLLVLLALGLVSGTAVAGLSSPVGSSTITGTLSVTTVVPTAAPTVTVTLPVTTITSPTVTLPATVPVTTAVTVPATTAVTAPLPVTTTAPAPVTTTTTTTSPRLRTTVTPVTSPPAPGTTAPVSTTPGSTGSDSTQTTAAAPAPPADPTVPGDHPSAAETGIHTDFATTERGAVRRLPPAGEADGPAEAPPARIASARFTLTGSGDDRSGGSAGGLAGGLPRSPLGLLLLGLAALLVAIAAIPRDVIPDRRLGALVADRRLELVSVGVTIFVTAVLTLALA